MNHGNNTVCEDSKYHFSDQVQVSLNEIL